MAVHFNTLLSYSHNETLYTMWQAYTYQHDIREMLELISDKTSLGQVYRPYKVFISAIKAWRQLEWCIAVYFRGVEWLNVMCHILVYSLIFIYYICISRKFPLICSVHFLSHIIVDYFSQVKYHTSFDICNVV